METVVPGRTCVNAPAAHPQLLCLLLRCQGGMLGAAPAVNSPAPQADSVVFAYW